MNKQTVIDVDVLVVGAGSAGCAAAIAAAETGATVAVLERSGAVGGTLVWQLLEHSAGFHDVEGNQVTGGIGQRIVDKLVSRGASPGHVRDDVGYTASRTPLDHAELSLVEATVLRQAGVNLHLHSSVDAVETNGDQILHVVANRADGRVTFQPKAVVDASGDAGVAMRAGATILNDAPDSLQPTTLMVKLGGIDFAQLLQYVRSNAQQFREGSVFGDEDDATMNLWGFPALLQEGFKAGVLSWERSEVHFAGWPRRGEAILNLTRTALDQDDTGASAAYLILAEQALEVVSWVRKFLPGGSNAFLAAVGDRVGVRESRRVQGEYVLTASDVLDGKRSAEAIGLGAFPIDVHAAGAKGMAHTQAPSRAYQIPYGCLVARGIANLFLAGRLISSTHEANGSARITATCFVTGEAAGVAAALLAKNGWPAAQADIRLVQNTLLERGALLEPIPANKLPQSIIGSS